MHRFIFPSLPLFFLYVSLFLTNSCSSVNHLSRVELEEVAPKLKCIRERGALDIGSGSTKFTLAKVNLCENKIVQILEKKQFPLKFKEHLSYNNGVLKEEIYQQATNELTTYFKNIPLEKKYIKAVATEVFRQAMNGEEFVSRLSQSLGIEIHLISQEEEALLGFKGAQVVTGKKASEIVVWDIGGGSMQMTSSHLGGYHFYKGKLASVSLKNEVLKWKGKKRGSPNPLGQYLGQKALYHSAHYAKENVPSLIKEAIEKGKEVIGVGGVHYYSIREQLNLYDNTPYSYYQLEQALDKRVYFHDQQFNGHYKETEATNIALVLGHMKELNIRTVLPVKVDLATGLLFTERFW